MHYLLDTHTFLWFINGDPELSQSAKEAILNPENLKYISIASFWEIAIKINVGKLKIAMPFHELELHVLRNGFQVLPITFQHIDTLTNLFLFHKDPFDRIIISQAISEKLTIIGRDSNFGSYALNLLW